MKCRLFKIIPLSKLTRKRKKEKTEDLSLFEAPCYTAQMMRPKKHAKYGEDSILAGNGIGAVCDGVGGCASEFTSIFADLLTLIIAEVDELISQNPFYLENKKRTLFSHDSCDKYSSHPSANSISIFYAILCHFADIYHDVNNEKENNIIAAHLQNAPSRAPMHALLAGKKDGQLPKAASTASFAKLRQTATGQFYLDTMSFGDSPIYVFSRLGKLKVSDFGQVHTAYGSKRLNPTPLQLNFKSIASHFEEIWEEGTIDIELNTMDVFETILRDALYDTGTPNDRIDNYSYSEILDHGAKAFFNEIMVTSGDVVMVASDGIKDNLSNDALTQLFQLAQKEYPKQNDLSLSQFFSKLILLTIFLMGDEESGIFVGTPDFTQVYTQTCILKIIEIINADKIPFTKERLAQLDQAIAEEPNLGMFQFNYEKYKHHLEDVTIKLDDTSLTVFEIPNPQTRKKSIKTM